MLLELFIIFIIGLIFGSFLNSLIYRLGNNLPLSGRSICTNCRKKLLNRDLVPILSFIWLKGKCRFCQQKISWQYPGLELLVGLLFAAVFINYGQISLLAISDWLYIFILLIVLILDWKYYIIPDWLIWPSLVISFIINIFLGYYWLGLIGSGLLIGGFFYCQYLISGKKWVGFGDVELGLLLGVMLGLEYSLTTLVLAYIFGGLLAVILISLKKKKIGDMLPMGSLLAGAAIIVLLWGDLILYFLFKV